MDMDEGKKKEDVEESTGDIPVKKDGTPAWYRMQKKDILAACQWRGLSTEGTSADMQNRLMNFLETQKVAVECLKKQSGKSSASSSGS